MERKLTAILCADVYGYSRLMGENEEATLRSLSSYRKIIDSLIEQHRGRFVNSAGDSVLAEFASVVNAVQCAVDVQTRLATENENAPAARRMEFRIGVNLGDVMVEGEQIYGDGVNVAARLESLAEPGGICISNTVHDQVSTKLALSYEDLGEQQVKNIAKPVRIFRVLPNGTVAPRGARLIRRSYWRGGVLSLTGLAIIVGTIVLVQNLSLKPPRTSGSIPAQEKPLLALPQIPSIAVLPFVNLSGDPQQEYFADGITDQIITQISRLPGLFVIDRNSSSTYKGKAVQTKQLSSELGVRYVVEGSVHKARNQLRITAQLVDTATGTNLWAQIYDRPLSDVFSLQDQIVQSIVTTLGLQLSLKESGVPVRQTTDNVEAYDDFLRAQDRLWVITRERNVEAQDYLKNAIALDPKYADAYVSLGFSYLADLINQWASADLRARIAERIAKLVEQALVLDRLNAGAYAIRSQVELIQKHYDRALDDAERSIALAPNVAILYFWLAFDYLALDQPAKAIVAVQKAMRLDPRNPDFYSLRFGVAHLQNGDYAEAIPFLKKYILHFPDEPVPHADLVVAYSELGREREAREEAAEVMRISPHFSLMTIKNEVQPRTTRERVLFERHLADLRKAGLK